MDAQSTVQLILLLVGPALLIVSALLYRRNRRFLSSATVAVGAVIDNLESSDSEGGTTYSPRFSFTARDGSQLVVQSRAGTSSPFSKGQQVKVLYDPAQPEHAKINTFAQLWLGTIICASLGLILAVAGLFLWLAEA